MGDLAVLRAIGYSKNEYLKLFVWGISIVLTGLIVGIMISILIFDAFVSTFGVSNTIQLRYFLHQHVIGIVLLAGLLASLFPYILIQRLVLQIN